MKNNQLTFLSSSISTSFRWFWILLWRGSDGLRSTSIIPSIVAHNLSSFRKSWFTLSNDLFKSSKETMGLLFIDFRFSSISARIVSIMLFFIERVLLLLKSYNVRLRFLGRSFVLSHLGDYPHLLSVRQGLLGRLLVKCYSYLIFNIQDAILENKIWVFSEKFVRRFFQVPQRICKKTNLSSALFKTKFLVFRFDSKFYNVLFHNLMTKLTNSGRFQHLLNRPTASYAVFKKSSLKSFFSRPLSKWFSFTFVSKQMVIRAIKVLIPQSIPSAVRSAIVSIRIFAVNSSIFLTKLFNVSKIRVVHFFLKILKGSPQTFNSTPAITLKSVMLGVVAPLLNGRPNLIEPSSRHSMFHTLSLANTGMLVNQFYTPLWITKSQLTDLWNKVTKK